MFSLMKTVVSYLWRGRSDQEAEKDDLCPEELPSLISFLQSDDRDIKSHDARIGINCVNGKVSYISGDYCLIDNYYYLDLRKIRCSHVLEVGTHITFSVFRLSEDEEWQINRVYTVGDEAWDEDNVEGAKIHLKEDEGNLMSLEEAEKKGLAQKRTVIGKVQRRDGRTVVIHPGEIRFSLDEVESSIVPLNGDWLSLETLVQLDQESGDLGGDVLKVVKVSALRVRLVENGEVMRSSENGFAVINNDILAFRLSYCPGYEPSVGDRVVLQAIESDCGNGCSWRATALAPADALKQKVTAIAENTESEEDQFLVKDKNGIVIKGDCNFGSMTLGTEAELVLCVSNEGDYQQVLLNRKFHIARSQSQMVLKLAEFVGNKGVPLPAYETIYIPPGEAVLFKFQCRPKFLGSSSELFVFTFRGFRIGRYLKVRVMDAVSDETLSICKNPSRDLYQRSNASRWQRHHKPQGSDGIVVPGVMPHKAPAFTSVRLPTFEVPDRLWDAVVDSDNPQNNRKSFRLTLEDIKKAVPVLDWDSDQFGLDPKNYKQYFHTLLHLEEIEMTLKIQERDLFGVTMHPTGPGGMFLALEVPGLAETRPSVMVGDRVIVTPHNNAQINSRTRFEGFVHRITKSEVWLRFGKIFHDLFRKIESGVVEKDGNILEILESPESFWNVSFHFSRTPLRRCHLAVDLALKHLGEDFIFPKKITIKKPQIYLSEFNEKVNKVSRKPAPLKESSKEIGLSMDKKTTVPTEMKSTAINVRKSVQFSSESVINGKGTSKEYASDGNLPKNREQTNVNSLGKDCEYQLKEDSIGDISSSSVSSSTSSSNSTHRIPVVQRLFGANSPPRKSLLPDSTSFNNQKIEVLNGFESCNGNLNGKETPSATTLNDLRQHEQEEFIPSHQKRTVKWFNQKLNKQQKSAVLNILKGEARPLPYVIFGPPGTGKTVTVVEAILQILQLVPESRIMVATPSNSSADLIAERILELVPLNPGELVRLIAIHCLEDGKIPSCLMPYCTTGVAGRNQDENDDEIASVPEFGKKLKIPMSAASLGRHRITIGTCVSLGQLHSLGLPKGHFTHVFLDEAGQSTEPEALIPLGFLSTSADIGWGQAILAGDPRQLGPVVISKLANHFGLGQALLARILTTSPYAPDPEGFPDKCSGHHNPSVVTRLIVNYRSVPKLLSLTSDMFYDGTLIPTVSPLYGPEGQLLLKMSKHLPPMKCSEVFNEIEIASPLVFHGVRGEEARLTDSPSWYNPMEAVQCLEYMKILYHLAELSPSDIGIITPYVEQVKTIRNLIGDNCLPLPKVGTVEEFQGQERLVILLSCVRTSQSQIAVDLIHALGFVSSSNRTNVATSRARALLIILGDPHLLQHDPLWNKVIIRCLETESYVGCDLPNSFSKRVGQSDETETAEESPHDI